MRWLKNLIALCFVVQVVVLSSCSDIKSKSVTWEDIARTIPANPAYIIGVNVKCQSDSILNDVWAKEDVNYLINQGIALDTVLPSHFVVVGMPKATFVTWPLPNPQYVDENVADWNTASLNNTVDAHILVRGKASLLVSSTQAWVVNNVHGEKFVNELLSGAMNTKAVHTQPYVNCITSVPDMVNGVVHYDNKYYVIELNREDGLLRVDVDAYDKHNSKLDIIEGFGRLPIEYVDQASEKSPFIAVEIEAGSMPELLNRLAKLSGRPEFIAAATLFGPKLSDVSGTVVARWDDKEIWAELPFTSDDAAKVFAGNIKEFLKLQHDTVEVKCKDKTVTLRTKVLNKLPKTDRDHKTPHIHSQTENPSALAFARLDLEKHDPIEVYFELAPTHARLQVDYKENQENLAKVMELVKNLVFRIL